MLFYFLLVIQVIAVLLTIHSIGRLINFRLGTDSNMLILTSACACIYSFSYLFEMKAVDQDSAMVALCCEFLGLSFLATSFYMFISEYCKVHIIRRIRVPMLVLDTIILSFAITALDQTVFFKSISFSETGYHHHLVTEQGLMFKLFMIIQLACLTMGVITIWKRYRDEVKISEKKRLIALAIVCVIPYLGVLIQRMQLIEGYDPTSLLVALCTTSLSVMLTSWKKAGVTNRAFSSLYESLQEGVIIADANKNYLDSNASAEFIFPVLKTWEPGFPMEDLQIDLCRFGKSDVFEVDRRYYTSFAKPILEERKQTGFLIIISDVTNLHDQMTKMSELKEEADIANKAKSTFLANMSHEMRTPLNAIIGMTELASRESEKEKILEYIEQIKASGGMLLDIICDTLDLSKAESGKLEIMPVEFDILPFLNTVINVINMRIGDKGVKFLVDVDPDIPKRVYGDDIRIRQILINFLGNAEKFTRSGYIKLSMGKVCEEDDTILITASVEDTGNGIEEDDLNKLFRPFSQVDFKNNRKIVGSGLGLAISAQLIREMGGTYDVESEYGKGSTFSFAIPVKVVDDTPFAIGCERKIVEVEKYTTFNLYDINAEDPSFEENEEMPEFPNARVLVVDDNKVNVKVLCAFLKQFGIKADMCFSGFEALEKVEEKEYDLIFMDHMMPDMDGAETAEKIRASHKPWNQKVIIVACSANVMTGAEELFIESGMNDCLSKPIQLNLLKKKLIKYL